MGNIIGTLFPPSFLPERDIPDLSGKIILVAGGNTGIGYETMKQLLNKNAKVYLAARSEEKAMNAIKRLEQETKKSAIFLHLDLADLPSVRKAAETKLDILFNNDGVMISPPEMLTAQNYDLPVLPALTASYNETKVPARVLHVSSGGHKLAPGSGVEFASIRGGSERDAWVKKTGSLISRARLYGQSKIGNIVISNYYAKTHSDVLVSCALHPGIIRTELGRHAPTFLQRVGNMVGAYTQLWGATVATPAQITGQYLVPWGKVGQADKRASNMKLEAEIVEYLKEQIKDF
ncbi:NAD-P-binding protein [Mycena rebaudengoi]|nr:NAD-P-binding protein [Mycena rebaudengoi]